MLVKTSAKTKEKAGTGKIISALASALFIAVMVANTVMGNENAMQSAGKDPARPDGITSEQGKDQEKNTIKAYLSADRNAVDFDELTEDDIPKPQLVVFTNKGNRKMSLKWDLLTEEDAFEVNFLDPIDALPPNGTAECLITLKGPLPAGDYNATFAVYDTKDYTIGACIELRAKVLKTKEATVKNISIYPGYIAAPRGGSVVLAAETDGSGAYEEGINWSISGNQSGNTHIDPVGKLYIGTDETASFTVRAESRSNPSAYAEALVETAQKGSSAVCVAVSPDGGGYVYGGGIYPEEHEAVIIASPKKGYRFSGWRNSAGETVSDSRVCKIAPLKESEIFTAHFERDRYYVTAETASPKKGSTLGSCMTDEMGSAYLQADPGHGYVLEGWYENGILAGRENELLCDSIRDDHRYQAFFKTEKHTVSVYADPEEGGTVSGGGQYASSETAPLKAIPSEGYAFAGYICNGKTISGSPELKITDIDRDMCVTALFKKINADTFTITAGTANSGGKICPSGQMAENAGGHAVYNIIPENGYGILAVEVDGKQISPAASISFQDINKGHMISVAFAPLERPVKNAEMSPIMPPEEAAKETAEKNVSEIEENTEITETAAGEKDLLPTSMSCKDAMALNAGTYLVGMANPPGGREHADESEASKAGGLFKALGVNPSEAESIIENGNDMPLLWKAYNENYLNITANNDLSAAPPNCGTSDSGSPSGITKTLINIAQSMLSQEEKIEIFKGRKMDINFDITNIPPGEQDVPVKSEVFYLGALKTTGGNTDMPQWFPTGFEIRLYPPHGTDGSKMHIRNADTEESLQCRYDKTEGAVLADAYKPGFYIVEHEMISENVTKAIPFEAGIGLILDGFGLIAMCTLSLTIALRRQCRR